MIRFIRDLVAVAGVPTHSVCCSDDGCFDFDGASQDQRAFCENASNFNNGTYYAGVKCPGSAGSEPEVECGTVACCHEDGSCENSDTNPFTGICFEPGDELGAAGSQCATVMCGEDPDPPPEVLPQGCITIRRDDDTGESTLPQPWDTRGLRSWTTDLCTFSRFAPSRRPTAHLDATGGTRCGSAGTPTDYEPGYFQPHSSNPMRAYECNPGEEPCKTHYGRYARMSDGYVRVLACGDPKRRDSVFGQDRPSLQTYIGYHYVESGYNAALLSYHTPYWVELLVSSDRKYCTGAL